jgi:hypothetical protein
MTREEFYTLTLRGLAVSFAVVGSLFVLAPDGTIRVLNAVGGALGSFTPAPESALRFWLSLGAAYMVLVTLLAWVAQRDLRRHRDLLWILAAGKAVSSLTCLVYYLFSMDAFVYLANFVVDGSIALTAIKIWVDVPHLGDPSRVAATPKSAGDESASEPGSVRDALLEALVPAGGPFPEGGSIPEVSAAIDELSRHPAVPGCFSSGFASSISPRSWSRRFGSSDSRGFPSRIACGSSKPGRAPASGRVVRSFTCSSSSR